MERRLKEQPELSALLSSRHGERFYVKDAETVRDDVRDEIFLSVGYGRDSRGRLPSTWDPLDRETGPDYLKAAVTLARARMVVVTSLVGKDLAVNKKAAPGVALLARFLDHANSWKSQCQPAEVTDVDASSIVQDILKELKTHGYLAVASPGQGHCHIDVAVIDPSAPGQYLLGIVLDGPEYHAVATAAERDRIHHEALQALGWRLYRIWSPDWVRRRAEECSRLAAALVEARKV